MFTVDFKKQGSVTVHLSFRSHALYSPRAHCNSKISKNAEHRAVSVCKITNAVHHKGPNLVVLISVHMIHFSRVDLDPLSEMSPRVGWNSYVYRAGLVQIVLQINQEMALLRSKTLSKLTGCDTQW